MRFHSALEVLKRFLKSKLKNCFYLNIKNDKTNSSQIIARNIYLPFYTEGSTHDKYTPRIIVLLKLRIPHGKKVWPNWPKQTTASWCIGLIKFMNKVNRKEILPIAWMAGSLQYVKGDIIPQYATRVKHDNISIYAMTCKHKSKTQS